MAAEFQPVKRPIQRPLFPLRYMVGTLFNGLTDLYPCLAPRTRVRDSSSGW